MEADCSQERQTDRMSWLDGGIGLSPFEKFIRLELFSKSKWTSGGFCSSCDDYKSPALEAKGVHTASMTIFSVGKWKGYFFVSLSVCLCFYLFGRGGTYSFIFFIGSIPEAVI